MPSRQATFRRQERPMKRRRRQLLDGVTPKKSKKSSSTTTATTTPVLVDLATDGGAGDGSQNQSANEIVTASSSLLKRHEDEVKKDKKLWSPDPTLSRQHQEQELLNVPPQTASASSEFLYTPMYRRYFGITPPNPRVNNPRLLEDYIDWYLNVYLEEELPWHSMNIGTLAERVKQSDDEEIEEAKRFAAAAASGGSPSTPWRKK